MAINGELTALQKTILKRMASGYMLQWTDDGWTVYSPTPAPDIEENRLAVNDLLVRGYLKAVGEWAQVIGITSDGIDASERSAAEGAGGDSREGGE